MDGMDDERPLGDGDGADVPEDPPEWSVPSPWMVPALAVPAPPAPPVPAPVRTGPNRLTAALVVALVLSMVTAAWAFIGRVGIALSRPTLSGAPPPQHDTGRARG